ncbi:MAG: L-threonylcarbamoyladenylate synthase [Pseudomonadota bacterium]
MWFAERQAVEILLSGGVIAHATEGVFGLAASAYEKSAFERVAGLKSRTTDKPFLLIAGDVEQVRALVSLEVRRAPSILATWPGPTTWVLPAQNGAPGWLCDADGRIALRITGHDQARRLCHYAGPLISTSANPAGERPALSVAQSRRYFDASVDFCLPGQIISDSGPSAILDGENGAVLRS